MWALPTTASKSIMFFYAFGSAPSSAIIFARRVPTAEKFINPETPFYKKICDQRSRQRRTFNAFSFLATAHGLLALQFGQIWRPDWFLCETQVAAASLFINLAVAESPAEMHPPFWIVI